MILETAAFLFSLAGAGFVALQASGKSLSTSGITDGNNFTDWKGNRKYFSPLKMQAWRETQERINYILTSAAYAQERTHHDFRKLTNGGKIDWIFRKIQEYYSGALHGFGYSQGGNSFSYLDFLYPGIDLNNLGAGSENMFELLWNDLNITCILSAIGAGTAVAVTGGAVSIPAIGAAAMACKR